jgi:hypothetical protein
MADVPNERDRLSQNSLTKLAFICQKLSNGKRCLPRLLANDRAIAIAFLGTSLLKKEVLTLAPLSSDIL